MAELAPGIVRDPDTQGGEPCVAGTRIPVRRIGHLAERADLTPAAIAERFELSLSDVHRALAYYYDHPDEMDAHDRRDEELERRANDAEPFAEARDRLQRNS